MISRLGGRSVRAFLPMYCHWIAPCWSMMKVAGVGRLLLCRLNTP